MSGRKDEGRGELNRGYRDLWMGGGHVRMRGSEGYGMGGEEGQWDWGFGLESERSVVRANRLAGWHAKILVRLPFMEGEDERYPDRLRSQLMPRRKWHMSKVTEDIRNC